jgi:uncharacterized protein
MKKLTLYILSIALMLSIAVAQEPQMGSEGTVVVAAPETLAPAGFGGTDGVFRFVVVGDVLAKGLGAGLTRLTDIDQRFETVNRFNESSGLARVEVYDWTAALPKILGASEVDGVVVLLGTNDRQPIRVGGRRVEFGTPEWLSVYTSRIDAMLAEIKSRGARAFWVTLPPMAKPLFDQDMKTISALHGARAAAAGVTVIDIRPSFSTPEGTMLWQDTDANGNPRRLRTREGIAFTRQGNDVVADLVMKAILAAVTGEQPAVAAAVPTAEPDTPQAPMFGQAGLDDVAVAIDAATITRDAPKPEAVVVAEKNTRFDFVPAANTSAAQLYSGGTAPVAPAGRFDDFAVVLPTE